MIKLFGFRLTPFFLFILGLEFLALSLSVYIGVLIYQGQALVFQNDILSASTNTVIFLILLSSLIMPGFYFKMESLHKLKKTLSHYLPGLLISICSMVLFLITNPNSIDSRFVFTFALISACIGWLVNNLGLFFRYWHLFIRARIN